jgi:ribonuclease R
MPMVQSILGLLRRNAEGLSFSALTRSLRLLQREKPLLKQKLRELEDRGLILRVKRTYVIVPQTRVFSGRVARALRRGLQVRPDQAEDSLVFIPARHSQGAVPGDRVELVGSEETGPGEEAVGTIRRVLERERPTLMGIYSPSRGRGSLRPFDSPLAEEIPLTEPEAQPADPGEVVEVNRETRRIVRNLGRLEDPGVDLQVVIHTHDLPTTFSREALADAETAASAQDFEPPARDDLRSWRVFTIDGADARDFDDAVSLRKTPNGNVCLGVHIADVSHYVRSGTALDREAYDRGTSVYFPEKTLPMLPEKLSNEVCSLVPGQDRLTVSVLMEINQEGRVLNSCFRPSKIRSEARLTYDEVQRIFEGREEALETCAALVNDLREMRRLAARMRRIRVAAGGLDFSHPEPRLCYEEGRLTGIESFTPLESHGLIEEFMLAANRAVAVFLTERNVPLLYRIHPPPSLKKLTALKDDLAHLGIALPQADKVRASHLQAVQERVRGRRDALWVSLRLLRSLKLAAYSPQNLGHFGLGMDAYTHFTSPIRRYPDLLVHRVLKQVIKERKPGDLPLAHWGRICSERERRAEEAEKDLVEWRIYRFMLSRLGDEFGGLVVEISRAGLVVELEDLFVTGIILYQDLGDDYFVPESGYILRGRRSGLTFRLGDRLPVSVASVDPEQRRMLLVPARE